MGSQACSNGTFETTCAGAVTPTAETCNAIDDDCDGMVDEGVTQTFYVDRDGDGFGASAIGAETTQACTRPTGFSSTSADCNDFPGAGFFTNPAATEVCEPGYLDENCSGAANEGCGCSTPGVSQPCCAGRGAQRCEARDGGATTLSECTVLASTEICNGIDDDCDGQTDETFARASPDGGRLALSDGSPVELDGGCAVGVGACARTGAATCTAAALVCSASPGAPGTETCNSLDDDCDGQVDQASASLCPVTGQTCSTGSCTCAAGQSVCGTSCLTLGATCSAGAGACVRSGTTVCSNGGAACDAVAGTPVAETCDGVDNDCDGTIDEGVTVTCSPDADNDTYATSGATSQQCPDASRGSFGNCPLGFVSPATSSGTDCEPSNTNLYRLVSTRPDTDSDTYCAGVASNTCVGVTAPPGRRFTSSCAATDDCKDTNPWAGTTCTLVGAYQTNSGTKQCGIGFPPASSFSVSAVSTCPMGFSLSSFGATGASGGGACGATTALSLYMSCGSLTFGSFTCDIRGTCLD